MTNDDQFKPTNKQFKEPSIPKTYEQFVLEDKQLTYEQQQDLYPDLAYEDVSSSKGYGPCTSNYCTHSREELRNQLREAERRLEELERQLQEAVSRQNNTNIFYYRNEITVIRQNISVIIAKIELKQNYFRWIFRASDGTGWTGASRNYRWHTSNPSHDGTKSSNWSRANFRDEWICYSLEVEGIDNAQKALGNLCNGRISMRAGYFGGNAYNNSCTRQVRQAISSLESAIGNYERGNDVDVVDWATE